jgi:hypothetical protein
MDLTKTAIYNRKIRRLTHPIVHTFGHVVSPGEFSGLNACILTCTRIRKQPDTAKYTRAQYLCIRHTYARMHTHTDSPIGEKLPFFGPW